MIARNTNKYFKADLKYDSAFSMHAILRPYLLVEFTFSDVRLETELLSVKSLIEETLQPTQLQSLSNTILHCFVLWQNYKSSRAMNKTFQYMWSKQMSLYYLTDQIMSGICAH